MNINFVMFFYKCNKTIEIPCRLCPIRPLDFVGCYSAILHQLVGIELKTSVPATVVSGRLIAYLSAAGLRTDIIGDTVWSVADNGRHRANSKKRRKQGENCRKMFRKFHTVTGCLFIANNRSNINSILT